MSQDISNEARLARVLDATPRELLHGATAHGITLLDRIHFTSWQDLDADDLSRLYDLEKELVTYIPHPEMNSDYFPDSIKARLIQASLGSETLQDAQRVANHAARTIARIVNHGCEVDSLELPDFYAAQNVVKQIWEGTKPIEFRG